MRAFNPYATDRQYVGPSEAALASGAVGGGDIARELDANFFISWQSDSGQEIQRKLLMSNKFLSTQTDMALYNNAALTKANHELTAELRAASEALRSARASVNLLRAVDATGGVGGPPPPAALSSSQAALAFAPTEEDVKAQRLAAKEEAAKRDADCSAEARRRLR